MIHTFTCASIGAPVSVVAGPPCNNCADGRNDAPLTMILDRNGNRLDVQRYPSGGSSLASHYIRSINSLNGRWIRFAYDSGFRITQAADNIGRTASYVYDASGRLTRATDANGGITQYTYDAANRMLTIKDPRQIVYLTNQYDTNGRVQLQTLANNGTYQFAYTLDGNNNVTQTEVTDPNGRITRTKFNSNGYTLTSIRALGLREQQTHSFNRDP